ncbi:MAG: EAL domain-containing protein [Pseudomonadota bacterium]
MEQRTVPAHMHALSVARQPIFDCDQRVYAYELLFRDGVTSAFPNVSGEQATNSVLMSSYVDIGLEQIAGSSRVFVNFTEETLLSQLPMAFPTDKLVVELLESIEPTDEVIEACRSLRHDGYTLALDDFEYDVRFEPLLSLSSIVKLDFLITPLEQIESMALDFKSRGHALLAEKVETAEQFQWALERGFDYFQGFFFSRPEVIQKNGLKSVKVHLLQLLAEISKPDFDLDAIEALVTKDVSTSYRLLKYVNSAGRRTTSEISTIRHAIMMMGARDLRNFVGMVLTADLAANKPLELTRLALIRARQLELIGKACAPGRDHSEFFLLGLFSLLDAMLDVDMDSVLAQLPLSNDLKEALLGSDGAMTGYLELTRAFERGDWHALVQWHEALGISQSDTASTYVDALAWADEMMRVQTS